MKNKETKVIAIVNHKGGVGKTTVTLGFGTELAQKGYKVLMIDFDTQGNLTSGAGVDPRASKTITEAIAAAINQEEIRPDEYIQKSIIDKNLDIIPCDSSWKEGKLILLNAMAREQMLRFVIDEIREIKEYDFVLIDNASSIEIDFINSCVAADEVLIVSEAAVWSKDGIDSILFHINRVKKFFNRGLTIAGIIFNDVLDRTSLSSMVMGTVKESYPDIYCFNNYIPRSVKVEESQTMNIRLSDYSKSNKAANAFISFTEEYLDN